MEEYSISQLQAAMADGRLTARQLTEQYLARIDQIDRQGPALNAIIELNPDALAIADALDAERRSDGPRGPLHGIPVILKDNVDTADKMMTTAGSLALLGHIAGRDAFLVRQLRDAGAVILGKANLSEWANFRSPRSSSGWSSRGGQTRNPYALDRNPCGSSSGSAVAVAANLCAVAVGTETDGSIICPAQTNGIVGLKPTLGLVSRQGVIPISHSQDTAGPMGRTVADVAALLSGLVGVDNDDEATAASAEHVQTEYTQFLDAGALQGARIGVAREYFGFSDEVDVVLAECLEVMRRQGAEIVDPVATPAPADVGPTEIEVLLTDFKADLNAYLATVGPDLPVHSVAELIAHNEQFSEEIMPYFGQERLLAAIEKGELTDEVYLEALANNHRLTRTEGIDAALAAHQLDAIVGPSGGPAWPTDWINGDHHSGGSSSVAAVSGYPSITVPAGAVYGLPVGISFWSGAWQEPRLLALAYAFEQAHPVRQPPQFLPTVDYDAG